MAEVRDPRSDQEKRADEESWAELPGDKACRVLSKGSAEDNRALVAELMKMEKMTSLGGEDRRYQAGQQG